MLISWRLTAMFVFYDFYYVADGIRESNIVMLLIMISSMLRRHSMRVIICMWSTASRTRRPYQRRWTTSAMKKSLFIEKFWFLFMNNFITSGSVIFGGHLNKYEVPANDHRPQETPSMVVLKVRPVILIPKSRNS